MRLNSIFLSITKINYQEKYKNLSMKKQLIILFCLFSVLSFSQKNNDSILAENKEYRANLNEYYADSTHSPLTNEARKEFDSIPFFPIDTAYYVVAKFVRIKRGEKFKMKTSTTRQPEYKVFGKAVFTIRDTIYELMIYQNVNLTKKEGYEDFLFLPFNDYTNGNKTYGGGRYLDLLIPDGDTIILDFNKAYNPYCAYTYGYSCPVPPKENSIATYIRAGVQYVGEEH